MTRTELAALELRLLNLKIAAARVAAAYPPGGPMPPEAVAFFDEGKRVTSALRLSIHAARLRAKWRQGAPH